MGQANGDGTMWSQCMRRGVTQPISRFALVCVLWLLATCALNQAATSHSLISVHLISELFVCVGKSEGLASVCVKRGVVNKGPPKNILYSSSRRRTISPTLQANYECSHNEKTNCPNSILANPQTRYRSSVNVLNVRDLHGPTELLVVTRWSSRGYLRRLCNSFEPIYRKRSSLSQHHRAGLHWRDCERQVADTPRALRPTRDHFPPERIMW